LTSPILPLAGVFILPFGLPWNNLGDELDLASVALGILARATNMAIMFRIRKRISPAG